MPLTKIQFNPGVVREVTDYSNQGGWFDCDKIRFRQGFPEKIGGWSQFTTNSFLGSCRALHQWLALDQSSYIGIGTSQKYYIESGGSFFDITPLRKTTTNAATFSATNTSSSITVTDTGHGAAEGDFVIFSGAKSLFSSGGIISADILNQEYRIKSITDANNYVIEARAVATLNEITINGVYTPTLVTANASDTGDGTDPAGGTGGTNTTVAKYQVGVGNDSAVAGTGWGVGVWGRGAWNSAAVVSLSTDFLRIWSHDNFGEDLLINVRDGAVYYWDKSFTGLTGNAVEIGTLSGSVSAPQVAKQVMVSDKSRHVICFGCDPEITPGVQDPLVIRFSDRESLVTWNTDLNNEAGELRISSGSEIIMAVETRQEILVFTDSSLHSMQFIGPPNIFGINQVAENISVIGPLSGIAVEDAVFWMGNKEFYVYTGQVQKLPCTVKDYVFSDFNFDQKLKVVAGLNSRYDEIWWFYPSANSEINNKYVVYNYQQKVWYYGSMSRTFWLDKGYIGYPIATDNNNTLLYHEIGYQDAATATPVAYESFIESSPIDISDGNNFMLVSKLLPDVTFRNSSTPDATVSFTLTMDDYPGSALGQTNTSTTNRTATTPVEQFTEEVNTRLRGRSVRIKISDNTQSNPWRLGTPRLDIRPDGRR